MKKFNIEIERGVNPQREGFKRILIFRHGETDATIEKRYSEDEQTINYTGKATALALREIIAKSFFEAVFSSPITRAVETAQIICDNFEILYELKERNYGDWRGKTKHEICKSNRLRYLLGKYIPGITTPKNGESLYHFYNRIEVLLDLLWKNEKQDIVIITHGSVIHTLMMYPKRLYFKNYWNFTKQNRISCGDIFTMYLCCNN